MGNEALATDSPTGHSMPQEDRPSKRGLPSGTTPSLSRFPAMTTELLASLGGRLVQGRIRLRAGALSLGEGWTGLGGSRSPLTWYAKLRQWAFVFL